MIGVNLFTNCRLNAAVTSQKVTDITKLISSVPHPYPVGIFCVCTFGWVIGNDSSRPQSGVSSNNLDDQYATEDDWPPIEEAFVIGNPNDLRNHFSVSAIIM